MHCPNDNITTMDQQLTRCNAMNTFDIEDFISTIPRLLQLSIEDWGRIYNPPPPPQQPTTTTPHEEPPFTITDDLD